LKGVDLNLVCCGYCPVRLDPCFNQLEIHSIINTFLCSLEIVIEIVAVVAAMIGHDMTDAFNNSCTNFVSFELILFALRNHKYTMGRYMY